MSDIDYRTWGATRNCKGCRFWSEMVARAHDGAVEAMCLAVGSPYKATYTSASRKCDAWQSGEFGAIDSPGGDPYSNNDSQAA